jgi:uncharacterized protein YhaN
VRILRLRVFNFRLFTEVDFRFSPGMNLVRGPNESGKSSLVSAITTCLFEKPGTTKKDVRSTRRWGAEEEPVIEMEFEHEGSSYRMVKDFGRAKSELEELHGGPKLTNIKAVQEKVSGLLGFSDSAHYLRTACVTHDQMVSLAGDRSGSQKLATMLREIVVGVRESEVVDNAIKELSGRIDELKRGLERPAGSPGTILRLQEERERLAERARKISGAVSDLDEKRGRLAEVERLIEEKRKELEDRKSLADKNMRLIELRKKSGGARLRFDTMDRIRDARSMLDKTNEEIEKDYPGFAGLDSSAEETIVKEAERLKSLTQLREGLAGGAPTNGNAAGSRRRSRLGWAAVAVGAVVIALGVALGMINPFLYLLIVLGAVKLFAGAYLIWSASVTYSRGAARLIDDRIKSTDDEIESLQSRQRELLESLGFKDPESFMSSLDSFREKISEKEKAAAGLGALLAGRTAEEVEKERRDASLEAAAYEAEARELEPFGVGAEELDRLTRSVGSLEKEVADLDGEKQGLSYHLEHSGADSDEAIELEENISWLSDEEERARKRLRIDTLALEAMNKTKESLLSPAIPLLARSVGETFYSLTGGRYDKVEVNEGDLGISVYSEEKGEMIPADEVLSTLSQGTVSQLYLASRLRLVEFISEGRRPPLIFDDSFSYFDDERLRLLWEFLLNTAGEQQVIVLTCTDRYNDLVNPDMNVIELGPTR